MLRSMTGFGRSTQNVGGYDILVEIRAVNHRYFEFSSRITRAYAYLEDKVKSYVSSQVSRGKIEVSVFITQVEATDTVVQINSALGMQYVNALREFSAQAGITDDVSASSISRFGDIFIVRKEVEDEDAVWENVKPVLEQAVENFCNMRVLEGKKLANDISSRLEYIENRVAEVEKLSPASVEKYRERLTAKLNEVLGNQNIDEYRILTEAAIFSEKIAVDEETVRLRSHIDHFRGFINQSEPIGRKLDFVIQEMNRETNTIGSKCQEIEISKIVVDIKSEIEKIREQIQNIE